MFGAILGDIIGAPYEFDRSPKTKEFPLFCDRSEFTDDTVMTIAIAEALMDSMGKSDEEIRTALVHSMQKWGHLYPDAGYGGMFYRWLHSSHPEPYGSFGNGSAMRVSSAGWLFDTLEETRHMARLTAEVTHNHPEGIKGAEAIASAIFMARTGSSKDEIKAYIIQEFGYDLSRTCDEIRPTYRHVETCQQTVPEAITSFLEGNGFEDVIRTAVSLGGDCDTLTDIACGMAEALYGIPEEIEAEGRKRLPEDMLAVVDRFKSETDSSVPDPFLEGNELIEKAISAYHADPTKETLTGVLDAIRTRMHADGHLMIPVEFDGSGKQYRLHTLTAKDGKSWLAAFTSPAERRKGPPAQILSNFIDTQIKACVEMDAPGIIINPWGEDFMLARELIEMIFQADEGVEYTVPDEPITEELLEDGSFLKRAIEICNRNRTQLNMIKLLKILRDSWVWIPCNAIASEADQATLEQMIWEAEESGNLDSMIGKTFTTQDVTRFVPDILKNDEGFFFPVFSTAEEMGEYGNNFSKIQKHFLEAANLARNNEKNVEGIVINAFSESIVIPKELFDLVGRLPSSIEPEETTE